MLIGKLSPDADKRAGSKVRIFIGTATTRAQVRTDVIDDATVGDRCSIGSFYLSNVGKLYFKVADNNADTDWEKVTTSAAD